MILIVRDRTTRNTRPGEKDARTFCGGPELTLLAQEEERAILVRCGHHARP